MLCARDVLLADVCGFAPQKTKYTTNIRENKWQSIEIVNASIGLLYPCYSHPLFILNKMIQRWQYDMDVSSCRWVCPGGLSSEEINLLL